MTIPTSTEAATKAKMLERVRALLALAENAGSEHEAELATERAAEIMQKYNIDKAMAEHRERKHVKPSRKDFHIDAPYATAKVSLLAAVGAGFRCQVLFSGSGTEVTAKVYGFEDDIDMVVLLYTSLLLQAASGARQVRDVREVGYQFEPVVRTRSARRAYILGFASSIRRRLEAALATAKRDDEAGTATGKEMVLASRSLAVKTFMHQDAGRIRTVRMSSRNGDAYRKGVAAGERANIHNRPNVGGGRAALTR